MPFISNYLIIALLMSLIVILLGSHFKKKVLIISYAIINALIASFLLFYEVLNYGKSEATFERKIHIFFVNDSSMIFYFVYIPLITIGSILPIIVFITQCIGKSNRK